MSEVVSREARIVHREESEARYFDVIASTDAVDSHGEIVEQSWDLERYSKNPVVLYAHNSRELPIGTASDVGVVDGQLRARVTFASKDANPLAEQVRLLVKEGVLRAVSVGFIPRDVRLEKRGGREVYVLSNNELLELSIVPIPSNPEALARMRALATQKAEQSMEDKQEKATAPAVTTPAVTVEATELRELRAAIGADSQQAAMGKLAALQEMASKASTLAARVEFLEREKLIEEGIRAGKLCADDRDPTTERGAKLAGKSSEWLRGHLELAVPMAPVGSKDATPPTEIKATLTAEEKAFAERYGVSEEEMIASRRTRA